jgi:hypothetical protein
MSNAEITTWFISLATLGTLAAFEYLALGRNPAYRKRELFRRGIGIVIVLGISGGHIHHTGGDWQAWRILTVFLSSYWLVALLAQRWELRRKRRLRNGEGRNGNGKRDWQKARETIGEH